MITLINVTPHAVVVTPPGTESVFTFPASGERALVKMHDNDGGTLLTQEGEIPLNQVVYGGAELPRGLEKGIEGPVGYIVSTMFADAYRAQKGEDGIRLFTPDSGPSAIRENGQIKSVIRLIPR